MIGHVPGGRRIPELRRALPDPKRNWAPRPVPSSPPSAGSRTAGSARRSAWPSWRPSSGCENCPWVRRDPRCRRGPALMLSAAFALRGSPDETPQGLRTGYPGRLITPCGPRWNGLFTCTCTGNGHMHPHSRHAPLAPMQNAVPFAACNRVHRGAAWRYGSRGAPVVTGILLLRITVIRAGFRGRRAGLNQIK